MQRREFLTRAALLGGAAMLGPKLLAACSSDDSPNDSNGSGGPAFSSILDGQASDAPIDTVVVLMMENRSFDHYMGWLAHDEAYLEQGRSRYGGDFSIAGVQQQSFPAPDGADVSTAFWPEVPERIETWRGCGFADPGHGWDAGRAQRDGGFLAEGSGNDIYALGYYGAPEVPVHERLARRFTTFDQWHCSILGPTYPNREYLHSAQSGGNKTNAFPDDIAVGFGWETIWDRLAAASVPARYYYQDLPVTYLFGIDKMESVTSSYENFADDAAAGELPNVVFLDPRFNGDDRNDDHPHADIRAGQRFLHDAFSTFVDSPHWERGAFIVTYDEWGGFFDHVAPPTFPDDRASEIDADNFGQAGFRVPSFIASPYARPGYVDHTVMEHTSVLRFLEWRFLGAPATGPGNDADTWFLTQRDRNAYNLGAALGLEDPDPEVDLDLTIDEPSPGCEVIEAEAAAQGDGPVAMAASTADATSAGGHPLGPPSESVWDEMVARGYQEAAESRRSRSRVFV